MLWNLKEQQKLYSHQDLCVVNSVTAVTSLIYILFLFRNAKHPTDSIRGTYFHYLSIYMYVGVSGGGVTVYAGDYGKGATIYTWDSGRGASIYMCIMEKHLH